MAPCFALEGIQTSIRAVDVSDLLVVGGSPFSIICFSTFTPRGRPKV